ncbi:LemA family protein [Planococcus sp. ISL-110]|uniref:LemA family protein n=1 Tax=Planococcus sp. ISL-110 TaxID=2819167 RepID=UPI001BE82C97|nr:LemA family protein [Planococcus sp. ISL-110]MBT2571909.1 LemA family protein [Planococcus sp. ISL-110]
MKKLLIPIIIIVAFIAIVAAILVPSYNGFVQLEEDVNQSYAQIENQLQRRLDLIPNLVETVKGFADQEQSVIDSVTDARSNLAGAESVSEQAEADAELSGALSRLLVVVENYPEIRSSENFQQLSDELAGTENRIAVARQDYNGTVSEFNRKARSFPGNMIAGIFGFEEKEYFEADPDASEAPEVDFGTDEDEQ